MMPRIAKIISILAVYKKNVLNPQFYATDLERDFIG